MPDNRESPPAAEEMPETWSKVHEDAYRKSRDPLELQFVVMLAKDFGVPVPNWVRDELAHIFEAYWKSKGKEDLNTKLGAKRGRRKWNRFHHIAREADNRHLAWVIGQRIEAGEAQKNKTDFWLTVAEETGWDSNTLQNRWRDELKSLYASLKASLRPGEEPHFLNDIPRK